MSHENPTNRATTNPGVLRTTDSIALEMILFRCMKNHQTDGRSLTIGL